MRAAVFYKKSKFEVYQEKSRNDKRLRSYLEGKIEGLENDPQKLLESSQRQKHAMDVLLRALEDNNIKYACFQRSSKSSFQKLANVDLVISAGGDGTFLETAQRVRQTPILGYNTDIQLSKGFYLASDENNIKDVIANFDSMPRTSLNRLEYHVNGNPEYHTKIANKEKHPASVLNDFRVMSSPPAMPLIYTLEANGLRHTYKGDGILASTSTASGAWIYQYGGEIIGIEDKRIQYINLGMRGESINIAEELKIIIHSNRARSWIDGLEKPTELRIGDHLTIRAGEPLNVIGDIKERQAQMVRQYASKVL